ncbi:hypothetical protein INP51_13245 [Blautia liquoris]|jgi:hypothetical protein|uniref:Uncharacterized protein n=1 Tax=Blautia liquoris TaxID=2779518 RepID=A0A7M2RHX7_9FIRM|nr:hypothetical protein [Blautia liquoris]QOV18940.1 hypothetical protein INP51_13245 [Blautia liquoris]
MIKNFVISVLIALLIQPHWTNVNSFFDAVICFSITFEFAFVVITDLEEGRKA